MLYTRPVDLIQVTATISSASTNFEGEFSLTSRPSQLELKSKGKKNQKWSLLVLSAISATQKQIKLEPEL